MRIGVAATPSVAIPTLNWLIASSHELALVISRPDKATGRGLVLTHSPVSTWALEKGIQLLQPDSPQELIGHIEDLDCVVTIGYGVLLPQEILDRPRHGFLNIHFSLLPAYRGAAPAQRAIEHGERTTGITVFRLDKGMDTGPIYSTAQIEINPQWRALELLEQLALLGPVVLSKALIAIEEGIEPRDQVGVASLAPKIIKSQAHIDWNSDAQTVLARIRAFYPSPIAWTTFRGESFKITQARMNSEKLAPSEICVIDSEVTVGCANGSSISLGRVIAAGKKEMDARDWARGARLQAGDHFG